jgi:hypothetical protein
MKFTGISLIIFLLAMLTECPDMIRIAACTLWGTLVSFALGPFLDWSAYPRLREKLNVSFELFWFGNVVLHVIPILMVGTVPEGVTFEHGFISAFIRLYWVIEETDGRMVLDEIYVRMQDWHWKLLLLSAFTMEAIVVPTFC